MVNRKDYTGFIASFTNEKYMEEIFKENNVLVPEDWKRGIEGFIVIEDCGRILELGFWNFDEDKQVGETFEVNYDDVSCWVQLLEVNK